MNIQDFEMILQGLREYEIIMDDYQDNDGQDSCVFECQIGDYEVYAEVEASVNFTEHRQTYDYPGYIDVHSVSPYVRYSTIHIEGDDIDLTKEQRDKLDNTLMRITTAY